MEGLRFGNDFLGRSKKYFGSTRIIELPNELKLEVILERISFPTLAAIPVRRKGI